MDEARVHSREWRAAVESCRRALSMPEAAEDEMETWVRRVGPERVLAEVAEAFAGLSGAHARWPARYFPYFLGCVLSHHGGGTVPHTAPDLLLHIDPPLHALRRRLDYYLIWFRARDHTAARDRWQPLRPPCGFEVHWPKTDWYPRQYDTDPDPELRAQWQQVFDKAKRALRKALPPEQRAQASLMLAMIPGHRYQDAEAQWWDAQVLVTRPVPSVRYRIAQGPEAEAPTRPAAAVWSPRLGELNVLSAPVTGSGGTIPGKVELLVAARSESFTLPPPSGPVLPSWTPLFLPQFAGYAPCLQIAGGTPIGDLTGPAVVLDPNADPEDREMARLCQVVAERAWVAQRLIRTAGGRPFHDSAAPGKPYTDRVREVYLGLLAGCRDVPSTVRRAKLRKRALRQVEREFEGMPHEALPPGWHREVEAADLERRRR